MPHTTTTDGTGGNRYTLEPGQHEWLVVPDIEFGQGNYAKTELKRSSTGNEQIQLALVVGNEDGAVTVIDYLTFTDKAAWRISTFLKSAGVYPGSGVDIDLTPQMCIGLTGMCETINELPQNGKYERTKVKTWLPAEEQHPERLAVMALNKPAKGPDMPPSPTASDDPFANGPLY